VEVAVLDRGCQRIEIGDLVRIGLCPEHFGRAIGICAPMLLNAILRFLLLTCLSLRYRIRAEGLDRLEAKDQRGILFLANHPALIDPLIVLCVLTTRFDVRALAATDQLANPVIGWLAERVRVRRLSNSQDDRGNAKHQVANMLRDTVRGLKLGEALLLYPAGRVYRSHLEDLRANSAAWFLARSCPEVRIVLVRTHGLWGSSFGRANGHVPRILGALGHGIMGLLKSGLFFAPRRHVSVEFSEPADFPRSADRDGVNRYLERYYNAGAPSNTYVPYSIWEKGGTRVVSETD
jgi:1-acyl-sn-glycerol-3-phosphate acyltransferase